MDFLTREDIVDAFKNCGIEHGSVLMLHSDAIFLAQTRQMTKNDRFALFFEALQEIIGTNGTLVIPTFTYSATSDEAFIVEDTPSTVGELTEYFRNLPEVKRSRDPILSVAILGAKAKEFSEAGVEDTFGKNSIFDFLAQSNAWLGCIASKFLVTHTHYVEQNIGVDYRFLKDFSYKIIEDGEERKGVLKYYARDLNRNTGMDLTRLEEKLKGKKQFKTGQLGRFSFSMVRCHDFHREAESLISLKANALIEEGA